MVDPGQFPVATEEDESLDTPASIFDAAQEVEEPEEPAADAEAEEQEEVLSESNLRAELQRLRQKIGTDEDVGVVKSQRDRLRNQLQGYEAFVQQYQQQMALQQEQQAQAQINESLMAWEQKWRDYIALQQTPQARQAAEQQFQHYRNDAARQMQLAAQEQAMTANEQAQRSQQAQQALIGFVTGVYENAAKNAGVDPAKLNRESYSALEQSFTDQIKTLSRLKESPPPQVPTPPRRGGRTGAPRDVYGWFDGLMAKKDYQKFHDALEAAKTFPGMRLEDIISR